jgi:riboflavin synthase
MFTGIIRYTGEIALVKSISRGKRFTITADRGFLAGLEKGISSVAIDGACHTIEQSDANSFTVFSSFETLGKTTLGSARPGTRVNLENSLFIQGILDGHIIQGHIDGTARLLSREKKGEAYLFTFSAENPLIRFLVEKDSIAIDGISLTMFNVNESSFQVSIIPETVNRTALSGKQPGEKVNIEINIFAKYAKRFLNIY